ncbi:hypothetical protein C0142_04825 [Moraxella catarrhalis]|nr:hypothetical protein [Moraxella catarrhalis]
MAKTIIIHDNALIITHNHAMRQVFRQILIKKLKNKLSTFIKATFIKATFRAMAILEHAQNKISQIL